jgi:hypothetical protein
VSSLTTWNRLEPLPAADDVESGLRAEIADPLWLLARQRQFGEFRGEDAGSPIRSRLEVQSARLSRYHPGRPGANAAARAVDYDDTSLPLEVLAEREPLRGRAGDGGLAFEAGLHFLRLLRKHRAAGRRGAYVRHYAFREADLPGDDPAAVALRRRAVGRVPNGRRLHADLEAARGTAVQLTKLPAQPPVPAGARPRVLAAANEFLVWWRRLVAEPRAARDAWKSSRLEHAFAVQADLPEGRVVLTADEYPGGRLDWHAFRAGTEDDLGPPARPRPADELVRTLLPAPVRYRGMPADRFWEIEDSAIRFGGLASGRTDLARLILAEFGLTYANDWFVIPIDLPVGSIARVTALTVTDTFGETTTVPAAADEDWRMYQLATDPDAPEWVRGLLFLPPALVETQESDPMEEVAFFRDEMANVVWGVERTVQGTAGGGVDRYEEAQRALAAGEDQQVATDTGDAQLLYRLSTHVPDHWHPFVPVRPAGAPPESGAIQLERRPMVRVHPDGTREEIQPRGRLLTAAEPFVLEEEEVPRSGAVVTRAMQLTRWTDGRYVLWSGRRKRPGSGEGASGLRSDVVRPLE